MRLSKILLASALALVIFGSTAVWAVGYEKRYSEPPLTAESVKGTAFQERVMRKFNEASFVEQYPVMIEKFASTVKDILSQFGLTKNEAP